MDDTGHAINATSYSRVSDAIRERIVSGEYQPGSRLKVNDLCRHLGISSNPVREALQQLQGEGLVVISPNRGATVRTIDRDLIQHIYDVGAGIDGILARRCAEIATEAQVDTLRQMQIEMEEIDVSGGDMPRRRLNSAFHMELGLVSGNMVGCEIRKMHRILIGVIRGRYGYARGRFEAVKAEHWAIIDAVAARDGDVAEAAARHHCFMSCKDALAGFEAHRETGT